MMTKNNFNNMMMSLYSLRKAIAAKDSKNKQIIALQ